ncbi:MAG: hypothetical protein HN348_13080 [Proteobacteria bacterium]|nr:hypothetical protein [Pseudomonadota bacterium]
MSTWYLTPHGSRTGMLLYVYRFDQEDADTARERFFSSLKDLESFGYCDGDGERLLAFHHTTDCGFVLTGRGAEFAALTGPREDEDTVDMGPTPWDGVLEVIRRGEYEVALERCREIIAEQPWHRNAYVAGAMLSAFLERYVDTEEFAILGSRCFPKDGLLQHYFAVSDLHQNRPEKAKKGLLQAMELDATLLAPRVLLAVLLIQEGRPKESLTIIRECPEGGEDHRASAELRRLYRWVIGCRMLRMLGLTLTILGALSVIVVGWLGLLPALGGLFVIGGSSLAFGRTLNDVMDRQRQDDVNQALRRLNYRPDGHQPVS